MEGIPEIKVEEFYTTGKVMYLVKEALLKQEKILITAGTNSSPVATRAAENLVRFGYATFEDIKTLTEVRNDRRIIKLIIVLKKTSDFQKVYDQNVADNKKKEEEREKRAKEKTKDGK